MPSRPTPGSRRRSSKERVPGRLDEQLCFALYAATNAIQRVYAPLLKALGLTYVQYLVLLVLWENDAQSVGEIGRRVHLDSGTLTPVLRRLETRGLISRRRSATDERTVAIRLTPAGSELEGELAGVRTAVACRAALSLQDFARLRDELLALHAQLVRPEIPGVASSLSPRRSV